MSERQYMTVDQAAERLGAKPSTVREWIKRGELEGSKIGGDKLGYRIPAEAVERRLEQGVKSS